MKKLITIVLALLSSISIASTDIKISVATDNNLSAIASATYIATKNSFFCKELSMNDGSPRRVPKRRYIDFAEAKGVITIPLSITSKCKYKRVGGASLSFEIKGKAEPYNSVSVFLGGGSLEPQVVNCEQIISGPSNDRRSMIMCFGDLNTTDSGEVSVIVKKD